MSDDLYRELDAGRLKKTISKLYQRIDDRFEGRGIAKICATLIDVADHVKIESLLLNRPNWVLRFFVGFIILLGILVFVYVGTFVNFSSFSNEAPKLVQSVEQIFNSLMLLGLGLAFLISIETRLKRARALKDLHELRSVVHVIDMHQLTKDPSVFLVDRVVTKHSPASDLSRFEMVRYLDYCSEMLSLTAKLAALYGQNMNDNVVVDAVSDIELLAGNLSRKIWQKITILETHNLSLVAKT